MNFRDRVLNGRGMTIADAVNDNLVAPIVKSACFGIEHVRNLPACIDFRLECGNRFALPYSLITAINYDKSEGIEIIASTNTIQIKGYNLEKLYDYLVMFRVRYISTNKSEHTDNSVSSVSSIKTVE